MLNGDLAMKNEAKSKKTKGSKNKKDNDYDNDEDASFHFIAFVPIETQVWKLDGLERQPQNLGPFQDDDWLSLAKPEIEARMAEYEEDQIEFGLLGIVQDPLLGLREALAVNVKALGAVSERLDVLMPDWKDFVPSEGPTPEGLLLGPDQAYGLDQDDIEAAPLYPATENKLSAGGPVLVGFRQELITAQARLRANIVEEEQSARSDDERAANRRYDYGPIIQEWVRMLSRKGVIKDLVQETEAEN